MVTPLQKRHSPVGSRPGTLVVPPDSPKPRMTVTRYDKAGVEEFDVSEPGDVASLLQPGRVVWLDVQGLGDERILRALGTIFDIHPLALEDAVNAPQRPKIEPYESHLLLICRIIRATERLVMDIGQISIFVGRGYVVSFQEQYGNLLAPVRTRIVEGKGAIRSSGSDYLAYALLDTIVDGYYPLIQELSDRLVGLETRIMARPSPARLDELNRVKSALALFYRSIVPQREALARLLREGSEFISEDVRVYLRDPLDHSAQLADFIDSNRDTANGLLNTYLSLVGVRTNEVMKVLTIMASIFIPLTFLAGIYGMNFEAMPELRVSWGYPMLLLFMAVCAAGMLLYFRRRGWLGNTDPDADDEP